MQNDRAIRTLLENAIDYAGLFPPAALELSAVVRRFAEYRAGPDAWALGRLVVPASRLGELSELAEPLLPRAMEQQGLAATPWHIAALLGEDPEVDLALVAGFNDRHRRDSDKGHAIVDVVELKVAEVDELPAALHVLPEWLRSFVELPANADFRRAAQLLREHGGGAKLRTGGITAGAFPSPETIASFLQACVAAGIPCKVTAGLHHAIGGEYPLTYESDSARGAMFGFVPVLLAASLARSGADHATLSELLSVRDAGTIEPDGEGIRWGDTHMPLDAVTAARTTLLASFGSCSFDEPLTELRSLGWL